MCERESTDRESVVVVDDALGPLLECQYVLGRPPVLPGSRVQGSGFRVQGAGFRAHCGKRDNQLSSEFGAN